MKNRQIPRAEWFHFFTGFNQRHQDELANVTVIAEKLGAQREASGLPFDGIVADRTGRRLSIVLGRSGAANVDHPVEDPVAVWVEMDEKGDELALEIESRQGTKTIVELSPAPVPPRER